MQKSACPAASGPDLARSQAESLLGEFRALLRQVGSPGVGLAPDGPFWAAALQAPPALGQFLENYLARLLLPCELPAIVAACGHARRGELRELLAQDHGLAAPLLATPFAAPSRRMGWLQLARLRPLRDCRVVQRYLAAVESGQAHGWHTVVYGVTLAVFSLPLRQGLLYYSQETLSVLASAAGRSKGFGQLELDEMLSGLLARLPEAVEAALAGEEGCVRAAHQRTEPLSEV
jgi:urease accessory protein UreF